MLKPTRPLRRGGPAPPMPGWHKATPQDFQVDEVPLYEPTGDGGHLWLWTEKTGMSTLDAVARLAAVLQRPEQEFGFAGMKDAQAVTRQWITIAGVDPGTVSGLELDGLRVLEVRRHGNKLKIGHLRGNRFVIQIRGVGHEHAAAAAANLAHLAQHGVPNFFGEQRFGKRGANLDKGLRILRGNPRQAARAMPKRLLGLIVSAVQSEVFNRVLNYRLAGLATIQTGDVAWLHRNGACFLVEDQAREQPRCAAFELSPSGPLPGPKMLRAQGEPGASEQAVLAELELEAEIFGRMPRGTHEGARRPLRVELREPTVEPSPDGLRLTFELPAGSYATAVLRELLVDVPWFG